jgi:hypothetical protein
VFQTLHRFWPVIVVIALALPLAAAHGAEGGSKETAKVVIPFDFESKGEKGNVLGPSMADMVWKKIDREKGVGGLITLDAPQSCRELCTNNGIKITPSTPLEKVKQAVTGDFDAQIGVWGSVDLAPGEEGEIYDLVVKCMDFSTEPPTVIYQCSVRTKSAAEIPHLYIQELMDKLYHREPGGKAAPNPAAEAQWNRADNPNLVKGGDFESGRNGVPTGWESKGGHVREPLGRQVQWIPEGGNPSNHVIRLNLDKGTAESTGNFYYSLPFPVEAGSTYRFQCRWRTSGPAVKVFIKCYDTMSTEFKPEDQVTATSARAHSGSHSPTGRDYVDTVYQDREVYRSQQNLKGPNRQWNVHTEDFTPRHTKYVPNSARIDLFAYLSAGVVEFDDIVVKKIVQGSASDLPSPSQKRHSMATKVTIEEMQQNERRSDEIRREEEKERKKAQKQQQEQQQQ